MKKVEDREAKRSGLSLSWGVGGAAPKMVAVAVVASLFVVFSSCKPSAGGDCKENATSCDSPTSRYACIANHYVLETCKGSKGCKEEKGTTVCDSSKGDLGDPCAQANVAVCGTDGKTQYKCALGKLQFVSRCSKDGCSVSDEGLAHCNDPFARVGDTCKNESTKTERGNGACNEDFKSELRCKDGKFVLTEYCRGNEGCVPLTTGPWCDRSIANEGDDCDPDKEEFARSCDTSKENLYTCVNHKLTRKVHCGGEGKCYVRQYGQDGFSHYQAECDQSLAKVGEDCVKDGQPACSDDLKDRLMCSNGKFILDTACKKGCLLRAPDATPFQCAENAAKAISDTPKKK